MVERLRRKTGTGRGVYFPVSSTSVQCVPTGCSVLDGVLGGGWVLGRPINIVGDSSTGKTLLAIEACANFHACSPKAKIYYREAEGAFDTPYAGHIGLPLDAVDFGPEGIDTVWDTVEDIFEDLDGILSKRVEIDTKLRKKGKRILPSMYVIDSLDALTSRAEAARGLNEKTYGTEKAKAMSELFRRLCRKARQVRCLIIVISQTRHKIGVTFGEKKTRAGGDALQFYSYQVLWLSHIKTLFKKISGIRQASGIRVLARCKKNKLTMPHRQCEFEIKFAWGIDDIKISVEWLKQTKSLSLLGIKQSQVEKYIRETKRMDRAELRVRSKLIRDSVLQVWDGMAAKMRPKQSKY